MDVLVTVKAYPSISQTYDEVVCVAGIRLDTPDPEWVRLFPVRYRDLPYPQRFKKYEIIRLRAKKGSTDRRVETWRPDLESIERGEILPRGGHWPARRRVIEPLVGPSMCALREGRLGGGNGPSLGLVRPSRVVDLRVATAEPWSPGQVATLLQGSLLVDKHRTRLEKPQHAFKYEWFCESPRCNGHVQTIVDWELGEAYRSWRRDGYDPIEAVRSKWLDDICAEHRETMFYVGDHHQHPGAFLVLGAFYPEYPPDANQLELALAVA